MMPSASVEPVVPPQSACAECLGLFPISGMMAFPNCYVCSNCKPEAVSKISRGEAVGRVWRKKRQLVIIWGAELPDACVRCNGPAEGYGVQRRFAWHHPALYVLLLVPLLYILIGLLAQRKLKVKVPLCPFHKQKRWNGILAGVALMVIPLFSAIVAANLGASDGLLILMSSISFLSFVAGLIWAVGAGRVVDAARVTRTHVFLKGASAKFLARLPEWPQT